MEQIILAIHLLVAVALVAVVLIQRSEGGGLGIGGGGGGGGGMGAFMSVRGTANLLTRVTAILAACFMATSLTLAILSGAHEGPSRLVEEEPSMQGGEPAAEGAAGEAAPAAPADQEDPLSGPLSE